MSHNIIKYCLQWRDDVTLLLVALTGQIRAMALPAATVPRIRHRLSRRK